MFAICPVTARGRDHRDEFGNGMDGRGLLFNRKQPSMAKMSPLRFLAVVGNMAQRSSPPGGHGHLRSRNPLD
jgi:hypothetical protein